MFPLTAQKESPHSLEQKIPFYREPLGSMEEPTVFRAVILILFPKKFETHGYIYIYIQNQVFNIF